jgi:hypothetical protein
LRGSNADEVRINDNPSKISKISKTDHGDNESQDMEVHYEEENFEAEENHEKPVGEIKIVDDSKSKIKRIKIARVTKIDEEP